MIKSKVYSDYRFSLSGWVLQPSSFLHRFISLKPRFHLIAPKSSRANILSAWTSGFPYVIIASQPPLLFLLPVTHTHIRLHVHTHVCAHTHAYARAHTHVPVCFSPSAILSPSCQSIHILLCLVLKKFC